MKPESRDTRPQPEWRKPLHSRPPDPPPDPAAAGPAAILLLGVADADLERELRRALPGWTLVPFRTRAEARAALRSGPAPALVLFDADAIGPASAAALCRRLRLSEARAGSIPAHVEIRLRACTPRAVRAALAAGADEIRPPLPAAALAALLAAKARSVPAAAPDASDDIRIDPATGGVLLGGRPLPLTMSEAAALRILVAWNGRPRTRGQLLRDLRGDDAASAQPRAVDSLVADLRGKLGPAAWRLETAWGVGYRWNAAPDCAAARAAAGRARYRFAAGGGALVLLLALLLRPAGAPDASPQPASPAPTAAEPAPRHSAILIPPSAWKEAIPAELRAAFALPAGIAPAVGIAVLPDPDL